MLKRSASVVAVLVALSLSVACNAREAVADGLIVLSNVAITANQTNGADGQPLLSTADTGHVLTYANQALSIVQAQANGWQATVKASWTAFEADLSASVKTRLKTQLAVLDAAIGAL